MGKVAAAGKLLGKAGKFLGPLGVAIGAGFDFQEGSQDGDPVRGFIKAGGGVVGGLAGGVLGAPIAGPVGAGLGSVAGGAAGAEGATKLYDRFVPRQKQQAQSGLSGLSSQMKLPTSQQSSAQTGGFRFGQDSPELAMGEMQYKTGQQALGNQRSLGMRNMDVQERLGLGDQYTQRAIAGTMANRDIVTNRDQVQGAVAMTGLNTNRDITVNRDQVRGMVDVTRLNTGRDIAVTRLNTDRDVKVTGLTTNRDIVVNRDQVRGAVQMTGINANRDIQVTGLQESGATNRTRLTTDAQKYIAGSGNLKTEVAFKLGLGDQYTQRYIGGSGDKKTQAMVDIERIRAGGRLNEINASGYNQRSFLDTQMRASQAESMNARMSQAQMQREMLDYQREKDKKQFDLQQVGLIASMYA